MHLQAEEEEESGLLGEETEPLNRVQGSNSFRDPAKPLEQQSQYLTKGGKCLSGRKSSFHDLNHNTEIVKKNKLNLKIIFFFCENTGGRKNPSSLPFRKDLEDFLFI